MKDISFDNPYLLFIAIPLILAVVIPFFVVGNKDNRSLSWKLSIGLHIIVIALVSLAAAGLKSTSVMTETTVYVLADVSYSSQQNLDEIDGYVREIENNLPENSTLGVVCFGKNVILLSPAGKEIKSVAEANVDDSATNIVGALNYTETLFKEDVLKRIVLITDGNDTVNESSGTIAATISRLTENGIKIDTIFLNNTIKAEDKEVQLADVEYSKSTYLGHSNKAVIHVQSSGVSNSMVELYVREAAAEGEEEKEYELLEYTVLTAEEESVEMDLLSEQSGTFEYMAKVIAEGDISEYNNVRTFTQEIVGKTKILLITGEAEDKSVVELAYGEMAEIDSYIVTGEGSKVPFMLEDIIEYDEVVISNVDVRNIRNVNAFIDSLDMAISQYGKSLLTFGDLRLQTDTSDKILNKFQELLPVDYGNTRRAGRLYTIVLDVSHSMFMASKLTIAKQAATYLLSVLSEDDYICLVTFSGDIKVQTPKKVSTCKEELIEYINGLTSEQGTDIGLGLEEALKTVKALKMEENHVLLISDGFSFDSTKDAVEVSAELYAAGATVSAVNTYILSDGENGRTTMQNIVEAGEGGNYYSITKPEEVESIVFGTIADDIGDVIVEKDAKVNVVKYNDASVQGFTSVPSVSGYIVSMEKYDAVVPLTVSHVKSGGYTESMPLYAYRSHGNGKVASFTSNLSGDWTQYWTAEDKALFIGNVLTSNTPKVRHDTPFSVTIEHTDRDAYIEIVPSVLNPDAKTTLKITLPTGKTLTRELTFDSRKFFYTLETGIVGTYKIQITYEYEEEQFVKNETFDVAYLAEYNAFAGCDTATVYGFMRGMGSITEGEIPSLENDESEVATYQVSYQIPLLIAAISVFVGDILIRKLAFGKKKLKKKRRGGEV